MFIRQRDGADADACSRRADLTRIIISVVTFL
jgi:hypothetical protein